VFVTEPQVLRDKLADPLADKVPIVAGACGTVVTVTEFDAELTPEVPIALEAVTVTVAAEVLLNPVIVSGEAEPVAVRVTAAKLS
jgi:hypothetical protein